MRNDFFDDLLLYLVDLRLGLSLEVDLGEACVISGVEAIGDSLVNLVVVEADQGLHAREPGEARGGQVLRHVVVGGLKGGGRR